MLRKDLDNERENSKISIADANRQIERIYDQNKWFLGLMFMMAIGLIGLAVSNFIQVRQKA
jgi:hypothetical protein